MPLDVAMNFCAGNVSAVTATSVTFTSAGAVAWPATGPYNVTIWDSTDYSIPAIDPNASIFRVSSMASGVMTGTWQSPADEYNAGTTLTLISGKTYSMIMGPTAKLVSDIPLLTQNVFNVKAYGAKGDGATDDAAAINAAITAAIGTQTPGTGVAGDGGIVFFPPGVYMIGSTITLYSNVILQGSGEAATIIRGVASTTNVMLQTYNFASLTTTNSTGGEQKFGLRFLGIDGNKANRASGGNNVNIYGYNYIIENVEIYESPAINLYTEWSSSVATPPGSVPPYDFMEAKFKNFRVFKAAGIGIQMNGPHDSLFVNTLVHGNVGNGAVFGGPQGSAVACMLVNFHAYGNATGLVIDTANITGSNIESESNSAGGINITTSGSLNASTVLTFSNTTYGISINSNNNTITSISSGGNTGNGVLLATGVTGNFLNGILDGNGTAGVALNTPGAGNVIDFAIYTISPQTAWTGTPGTASFYRLGTSGYDINNFYYNP